MKCCLLFRLGVLLASLLMGAVSSLWILWVVLTKGPREAFSWRVRKTPPSFLVDNTYGEHQYLQLKSSGLHLHYITAGLEKAPLLLFLHGSPQNWFCWRHQLREFQKQFRVVALDLWGYGASAAPREKKYYDLKIVAEDVREVIETLGTKEEDGFFGKYHVLEPLILKAGFHQSTGKDLSYAKAIVVGHDWGGFCACVLAARHPRIMKKLILINSTHPTSYLEHICSKPSQLLRSSYMFLFQLCGYSELLLSLGDFQMVKCFLTSIFTRIRSPQRRLKEQELEAYLYRLSQPRALTSVLNYYRSLLSKPPEKVEDILVPTLVIWGEKDVFLETEAVLRLVPYLRRGCRMERLPNCSHWVPEDQPEKVNQLLWGFLQESN